MTALDRCTPQEYLARERNAEFKSRTGDFRYGVSTSRL